MNTPFQPRKNIEGRFAGDIFRFLTDYFTQFPALATGESAGPESAPGTVRLLNASSFASAYAEQAARRMVGGILTGGASDWRLAARESLGSKRVYTALRQELRGPVGRRARELALANAQLIKSLPSEIAAQVTRRVQKNFEYGERAEAYEKLIPRVVRWKARLIARTETSKASTALTRARSEDLGLRWYVWRTSKDQRVRPSHKLLSSVLVRFEEPPSPERLYGERSTLGTYNAGDAPNCRCYSEPLIYLSQVAWPHKVFYDGRIQMYTLARFRQIVQLPALLQLEEAA